MHPVKYMTTNGAMEQRFVDHVRMNVMFALQKKKTCGIFRYERSIVTTKQKTHWTFKYHSNLVPVYETRQNLTVNSE